VLLRWWRQFADDIEVLLDRFALTVRCRHGVEVVRPIVFVSAGSPTVRVLAVGAPSGVSGPYTQLDVFDPAPVAEHGLTREQGLELVLRYGIARLRHGFVFLRPEITFSGSMGVADVFAPSGRAALVLAANHLGARKVNFASTGSGIKPEDV